MADRGLRNTTINISWNVNGQPLQEANRLIDESIRASRNLDRENASAGRQIEQTGRQYASTANEVRNNSNALRENTSRARDTDQQQGRLSSSARRTGESFNDQSRNIENTSRTLKNFESAAARLDDTLKMIGVGYFADKVLDIGKAAVKTGMDFDKQMSAVKAISGATESQFKALEDQAISLGASTTKSASEVAAGQLEMAKSGFTVNQTLAAMSGLISASTASGEDMARTAEVMTAALNSFNLSADQANHVADVLAQAANDSAADINDLGYAFKYAAAPAHALGMSLEEVSAATEIMSNAGIKGETAGTALRSALLRLADPPKEASKVLNDLGVKITDSSGKMLPFSNIIGQLNDKTKGMADAQKTAALSAVFGTEAVSGMLSVVNAGPEKLDALTKSLKNSDGASKKAADAMSDNFAGAVEQLEGTIESIAISVSKVLTPSLRTATDWLSNMGEKFNDLSPTGKQIAVWGSIAVASIVPAVYIFKKASDTVSWLRDTLSGSRRAFSNYREEMDHTRESSSELNGSSRNTAREIENVTDKVLRLKNALLGSRNAFKEYRREMEATRISASEMASAVHDANRVVGGSGSSASHHNQSAEHHSSSRRNSRGNEEIAPSTSARASISQRESSRQSESSDDQNLVQEVLDIVNDYSENDDNNHEHSENVSRREERRATRRGNSSRRSHSSETVDHHPETVLEAENNAAHTVGRAGRLARIGTKLVKGTGYLSTALSAVDLITSPKEKLGDNIGGMTGSVAGMAIGSALGSAIAPGLGTALGGAIGSWAGTALGSRLGDALQKDWPKISKRIDSFNKEHPLLSGALSATPIGSILHINDMAKAADSIKKVFKDPLDASIKASNGISKSTAKAINDYENLNHKASEELSYLAMSGDKMSAKTAEAIHKNFNDMASKIDSALDKKASKSKSNLDFLVKSGAMSADDAAKATQDLNAKLKKQKDSVAQTNKQIQDLVDKMYREQETKTKSAEDQINAIKNKALKEGRKLTKDELDKISDIERRAAEDRKTITNKYNSQIAVLQKKQEENAVAAMSNGAKEQNIILGKLKDSTEKLSAQQAAAIVKHSKSARDEAIKAAKEKYEEVMKKANEEYYVSHSISKEKYETIKKNAEAERDAAIKAATDMHNQVVDQAQKQAAGHYKEVDWETDASLSKWDNFVISLAEKVNAVSSFINKILDFFHISAKIPMWKPTGYASAQSLKTENFKPSSYVEAKQYKLETGYASGTNYHPGGHSLVGEEGPELAYIPYSGKYTLLGVNGPEIADIPAGTTILPASQTKAILNGGLGAGKVLPGYASGVGDFFKTAFEWVLHPIEKTKELFAKYMNFGDKDIGPGKGLGVSILEQFQDKASAWLKQNLSSFSFVGESASGGSSAAPGQVTQWILSAMALTGAPASWLQPLITIAMHESGGNPSSYNDWDINAKRGIASRGLMQVIPPTFAAYKVPGYNDIMNPVHNAAAAINYIKDRYGSPFNTPGIRSMASGGKYKGYKDGGEPPVGEDVLVGEDGPELFRARTPGQIFNAQKTQQILKNQNGTKIEINAPVTITIQGNAEKGVEMKIKKAVDEALDAAFEKWTRALGLELI